MRKHCWAQDGWNSLGSRGGIGGAFAGEGRTHKKGSSSPCLSLLVEVCEDTKYLLKS